LAIANQMLKYVWLPEYRSKEVLKKNSFDWWATKIPKVAKPGRIPIGSNNIRKVTI